MFSSSPCVGTLLRSVPSMICVRTGGRTAVRQRGTGHPHRSSTFILTLSQRVTSTKTMFIATNVLLLRLCIAETFLTYCRLACFLGLTPYVIDIMDVGPDTCHDVRARSQHPWRCGKHEVASEN